MCADDEPPQCLKEFSTRQTLMQGSSDLVKSSLLSTSGTEAVEQTLQPEEAHPKHGLHEARRTSGDAEVLADRRPEATRIHVSLLTRESAASMRRQGLERQRVGACVGRAREPALLLERADQRGAVGAGVVIAKEQVE